MIDEGSVAGEQEFKDYVRRFYRIFNIKKNHDQIHHMFIPGDNDIGGEGWDRVTPEKVERFEWAFHAPIEDEEIFKFITFDRANIMPGKCKTKKNRDQKILQICLLYAIENDSSRSLESCSKFAFALFINCDITIF